MENILQGLYIGVIGMGILFAALGLLSLVISLMDRLFGVKEEETDNTSLAGSLHHKADDSPQVRSQELAAAAAVAVAILQSKNNASPDLGLTLENAPGNWRSAYRDSKPVARKQ